MRPEVWLALRIAQFDIILQWVTYFAKVLVLPTIVCAMFVVEHFFSKSIKRDERKHSKWQKNL